MLLRLISVISLIQFLLLLVSGVNINIALYRSLIVFLILFSVVYISMFLFNIIKDNTQTSESTATESQETKSQNKNQD